MSESLSGYKIGFIGLGNMGWPMAGHLQDSGADIVVWNRSDEPKQRAAERAMLVATDAEALAGVVGDGGDLPESYPFRCGDLDGGGHRARSRFGSDGDRFWNDRV